MARLSWLQAMYQLIFRIVDGKCAYHIFFVFSLGKGWGRLLNIFSLKGGAYLKSKLIRALTVHVKWQLLTW